jgi:integrase
MATINQRRPKPPTNLGRREVTALLNRPERAGKAETFFDAKLRGFGLRFHKSGAASWIVEYRVGAGGQGVAKKRVVLGHPDTLQPEEARAAAKTMLARIELGADPAAERAEARRAETVSDLIDAYLKEHVRTKRKASTARSFESIANVHIRPAIGTRKANGIKRADVSKMHGKIGETQPEMANRAISFLSAVYAWAAKNGALREDYPNPACGIERFPESGRERYLTAAEFARLGDALKLAETTGIPWTPDPQKKTKHAPTAENRNVVFDPWAIAAIRLLVFTGCRLREVLKLKWSEVDLERGLLFLGDSKTGRKTVVLGAPALEILTSLARVGDYVIAAADPKAHRADLNRPWARISAHAGLTDVRLHDLRHSFASVGAGGGLGLPIIGRLLGHANVSTTQRYAHLADDPLRRAADAISRSIEAQMAGKRGGGA